MTQEDKRTFSFEYFPPRSEKGELSLAVARKELSKLKPAFASVTFGAGGSTQDGTYQTVSSIIQEDGIEAAPHISCISTDRATLAIMLADYQDGPLGGEGYLRLVRFDEAKRRINIHAAAYAISPIQNDE